MVFSIGQYKAAINYVNACLGEKASLLTKVSRRGQDELLILKSVATIKLYGPDSDLGRHHLDVLVEYYANTPPLEPLLNLLDEYEDELFQAPGADWALHHAWALLKLTIKHGNGNGVEDLKFVESMIRRRKRTG